MVESESERERRGDGDFRLLHAEVPAAGGHRHQAQAAAGAGHREADLALSPLVAERHRAAEQVDQAHFSSAGSLVGLAASPPHFSLPFCPAMLMRRPDVAEVVPVAQLGEEEAAGRGLEAGDAEDADIDRGESVTMACAPWRPAP